MGSPSQTYAVCPVLSAEHIQHTMKYMDLRITCLSIALTLPISSHSNAATSIDATMELQGRFPVCSEVLKEKQNPSDNAELADERPEGPEIIKILNELKRQRADINAFYSLGTPLHHAACAGREFESNWLLRNGADPLLKVEGDSTIDALGVAVKTENLAVSTVILKHYQRLLKAQNTSEKQQKQIHASVQAALQQDQAESKGALEKLLLDLRWQPSLEQWGNKFGELLCSRQPKAALELLKTKPWKISVPRQVSDATWTCPMDPNDRSMNGAWLKDIDIPTWLALDAELPRPVLLPLTTTLPKAKETQVLQAAVARGLRAPWSGKDNATAYFKAVLSRRQAPAGAEPALLRLISMEDLPMVLSAPASQTYPHSSDARLGGTALIRAHAWPVSDLEWLLKNLSATVIKDVQLEVSRQWSYADAEHWTTLTPHLIGPISLPYGYPKELPYTLWSQWKALGAVPDKKSWSYWLNAVPLADLPKALPMARTIQEVNPKAWPTDADWANLLLRTTPENVQSFVAFAKTQRSELLPRFMDWALAPLSYGPTSDTVALQIPRTSERSIEDHWLRVRQLETLGLRSAHPRYLAPGLTNAASPASRLDDAIKKGWGLALPTLTQPSSVTTPFDAKWVKPQFTCRLQVDDALRHALAENQSGDEDSPGNTKLEYALPVQVKGMTDCQWLFVGGRFPGSYSWTEHDFFEGTTERRTNAADGNRVAIFWHAAQKRWIESGVLPNNGELFNLQQSGQPEPWIVASGIWNSNWNENEGNIFQARLQLDGAVVLEPLAQAHPARLSLIAQCGSDLMLDECETLKDARSNVESDPKGEQAGIRAFVDTYWPQEKQAFLAALLANDRAALSRMRDQGLTPDWLSEGLQSLGKAGTLSLLEKRRRAAWVLASNKPAPQYDDVTLASLVAWLPPEDWRPIVKILGCYRRERLLELKDVNERHDLLTRLQGEKNRFPCRE